MIPHVWTEADESRVATSLGFDPGHPLVKAEMSRILSRGPSSLDLPGNVMFDALLPGLQIIDLNFEEDEFEAEVVDAQETGEGAVGTIESTWASPASEASEDQRHRKPDADRAVADSADDRSPSRVLSMMLIGVAVLGFLGGALIMLFGRRGGS